MNSVLQRVAEKLGLAHRARSGLISPEEVRGKLDGQAVSATLTEQGVLVEAKLEPALDLGLSVRGRNFFNEKSSLRPALTLGNADWDAEVHAAADDPARARLLIGPELMRAMLSVNALNLSFQADDAYVRAYERLDEGPLGATLVRVAEVARRMDATREALPVPYALMPHEAVLRGVCQAHGLGIATTPLRAHGALGGASIDLAFERCAPNQYALALRVVPLEPGPALGLRVHPTRLRDKASVIFGGQDVRVGDEVFDRAFRVEAGDEPRAAAALDREARALLQELAAEADSLELTDEALVMRGGSARIAAGRLSPLLLGAATLVERVARASSAELRGPYR